MTAIDPLALVVAGLDAFCATHGCRPEDVEDFAVYALIGGRTAAIGTTRTTAEFDLALAGVGAA